MEINTRLGIIVTGGEDNYIYIRKLYDLELLTPIKIKDKYIILIISFTLKCIGLWNYEDSLGKSEILMA